MKWWALALLVLVDDPAQQGADDFLREGSAEERVERDALEWKSPPALRAVSWTGTDGNAPVSLRELAGQVVVIAFWDETSPTSPARPRAALQAADGGAGARAARRRDPRQ